MKKYYVHYYRDFGNTYNLYWAETPEQVAMAEANGYTRVTRKKAEKLCYEENYRRKYDSSCAYYASAVITPIDYDGYVEDDRRVRKDGYIVVYKEAR